MAIHVRNTIDRAHIIITEAKLGPMNAQAAAWDPDTGGGSTFGPHCRLSPTGADPATHYGTSTRTTAQMKAAISGQANSPHTMVYWESAGWSWDAALADCGLQRIVQGVV